MADENTADLEMDKLLGALNEGGESSDAVINGLADEASKVINPIVEGGSGDPENKAEEPEQKIEQAPEAPEKKPESQEPDKKQAIEEDRKRVYLHDDLPIQRKAEIEIMAKNPDMPIEQVKELVAKQLEGITEDPDQPEPSPVELAKASLDRLKEVNAAILEKERDFKHDEEWEKLMVEKDQLLVDVPILEAAAREEALNQRSMLSRVEAAEAKASEILPGLNDETSENYALVAGRVAQLIAIKDKGKELPVIEIDGVKHALDPDSPDFPVLVATDVAKRTGSKTSEAKPEVTEQRPAVTRQLVSTPAASPVSASQKHRPEGANVAVSLREKVASVKSFEDLNVILDEDTGAWGGANRFSKRVL